MKFIFAKKLIMNKRILKLALPNIISNITVPLLGLVDISMMGHLDSVKYLGAIALGSSVFSFIYMTFGFLRMSTSGFTAQAYGQRDFSASINWLSRAILLALIAGFTLILFQIPIKWAAFKLLEANRETEQLAVQYFLIRIWAAPATISLYALTGWFIGMQNAKTPMFTAVFINLVNIGANVFFVFVADMKSDGVALGTVIAQYSGLLLSILILKKFYGKLFRYFKLKNIMQIQALLKFVKVNTDIFIRTLCLISVVTFFTYASAQMGDNILAVNTLLLQFFLFFSYLTDGFSYAAEALSGSFYGADNIRKLKLSVKYIFIWGGGTAVLFSFLYLIFFQNILYLLTDNLAIINLAVEYKFWIIILPLASFAAFVWDGIYIGLTASDAMRNTMLLASALFFLLWFSLKSDFENNALWFSMLVFLGARGLIQTVYFKKIIKL